MSKQMIVNATAAEEIRVAIVENNRLSDLDIESQSRTKQKGNIYKGIVANVEDSLEAAFIEFGDDKQGFLALAEVRPALYPEHLRGTKRPKISDVLKRGQEIVVQVTKDEIGNKGAAVTTYLSLPGRYVVLMHSDDGGGGISRKIDDEGARRRAREVLERVEVPEGMAVIVRTAGMNRARLDLFRDLQALARTWEQIDRGAQLGRAPTLLYREPDLVVRTIRDYLAPDVKKIIIDNDEEYEELKSYFEDHMPESVELLDHYDGSQPVFEHFGIERAIEELFERQVKLPAGGYLIIDQTEALVAVDVNSGRSTKEDDHEATVYKTNLEAARELARQLRLRDLGGIIVVDFIDMQSRRHDRDVERVLKEAMRDDKAKVKIGRISENGTLELTRQRLRQAHRLVSFTPCAHCKGTGVVRDPAGLAVAALRQLHTHIAKRAQLSRVICKLPVEVANVLNNRKRRELLDLSQDHDLEIEVWGDDRLTGDEVRFEDEKRGRAGIEAAQSIRDPRLDGDRRGRRGRRGRGRHEEATPTGPTLPAPSIGPVPVFLETEEAIALLDAQVDEAPEVAEWEADDAGAPAPSGSPRQRAGTEVPTGPVHYDDPLLEALFGDAPELTLQEAEAPATAQAELGDEPRKKRRRSRRRRGRKRTEEGQEAANAAGTEVDDEDAPDHEGNDDDEGEHGEIDLRSPLEAAGSIGETFNAPPASANEGELSAPLDSPPVEVRNDDEAVPTVEATSAGVLPAEAEAEAEAQAGVDVDTTPPEEDATAAPTGPATTSEGKFETPAKPRRSSTRRPRGSRRSPASGETDVEPAAEASDAVDDGAKPRRKRRSRASAAETSAEGAPPPSADA